MFDASPFVKYLQFERHYSKHTVAAYERDIRSYAQYLVTHAGLADLISAKHIHVRSWLVHLMSNNYTPKSINRKLSAIKSLYKFLKRQGVTSQNPAAKISGPKTPKRLPKVVRAEDIVVGLQQENLTEVNFSTLRDRLIVDLLYHTGMRRSELIGLKQRDFNRSRKELKVLGKGNKERVIPVSPNLAKAIQEYLAARSTEVGLIADVMLVTDKGVEMYPKYVYNKVKKWIGTYSSVEKRSPHILRHSFATHLADNGAELNAIKELLGHANLSATQIYTHNSVARLQDVYKKAHPKGSTK